mgnify:CR=1 FL=1
MKQGLELEGKEGDVRVERRIRLLGVAPYEGMEALMQRLAGEYPQVELTSFVGDMEQG